MSAEDPAGAFERGKAAEALANRLKQLADGLSEHEKRLERVDESIARTGRNLGELSDKLEAIGTEQKRRDSVNAALVKANEEAAARFARAESATGTKRLARWQQVGIVVMAVLAAGTLLLALIQTLIHG